GRRLPAPARPPAGRRGPGRQRRLGRPQPQGGGAPPAGRRRPQPDHPHRPEGSYKHVFAGWEFDGDGRLSTLELGSPAYFTDTEPAARARIEQVVQGKAGRAREYRFDWDEECNRLLVS